MCASLRLETTVILNPQILLSHLHPLIRIKRTLVYHLYKPNLETIFSKKKPGVTRIARLCEEYKRILLIKGAGQGAGGGGGGLSAILGFHVLLRCCSEQVRFGKPFSIYYTNIFYDKYNNIYSKKLMDSVQLMMGKHESSESEDDDMIGWGYREMCIGTLLITICLSLSFRMRQYIYAILEIGYFMMFSRKKRFHMNLALL
ncbi:hypothetical protein ACJX0J_021618, partial [Zea mays]